MSTECNLAEPGLVLQQRNDWDDFGQLLSRGDGLGRMWRYGWDGYGNLVASQSPEQAQAGRHTTLSYAPGFHGLLSRRQVPAHGDAPGLQVVYSRDALGRIRRAQTLGGNGALVHASDDTHDLAGRVVSRRDSRGLVISWDWSAGGRLRKRHVFDGGKTLQWQYFWDGAGRLAAVVAPQGQTLSLAYDEGGRVLEQRVQGDGPSVRTQWQWHAEGSLRSIEHRMGSAAAPALASQSLGYNAWGQRSSAQQLLAAASSSVGTSVAWDHDALGRLAAERDSTDAGGEVRWAFDVYGNRIGRSQAGQSWTAQHDAAQQLRAEGDAGGTAVRALVHDLNGRLTQLCEGSGVSGDASSCSGSRVSRYSWNGAEQLVGVTVSEAGVQTLAETYAYDDQGRRISKTSRVGSGANSSTRYLHDGADVVLAWGPEPARGTVYTHGAGQAPALAVSQNAQQPEQVGAAVLLADGLGSVRTAVGPPVNVALAAHGAVASASSGADPRYPVAAANDGDRTGIGWLWGRQCCWSSGPMQPGRPEWLQVRFAGSRTIHRVDVVGMQDDFDNGVQPVEPSPGMTWSAFYGLIDYEVQYWNPGGNQWVTVPGGHIRDNRLVWTRIDLAAPITTDRIRVLVHQGASGYSRIVEVQAWSHGVAAQGYSAWGQRQAVAGGGTHSSGGALGDASAPVGYGWTGVEHDASGLSHHQARYYHPGLGRFISPDPLGLAAGINPYQYGDGDPVSNVDPQGLLAQRVDALLGTSYFGDAVQAVGGIAAGAGARLGDFGAGLATGTVFRGVLENSPATVESPAFQGGQAITGTVQSGLELLRALGVGGNPTPGWSAAAGSVVRGGVAAANGWRVGDDVYAATRSGAEPAWSTVRSRFWKNEGAAEGAAGRYGAENLDRMRAGKAPQRYNPDKGGVESMELSHEPIPLRDGGRNVVPRWPQDHAAVDPFRRPGY